MPGNEPTSPTYSLTRRGTRFYVQWWEDGAARRLSCGTAEPEEARRFLAEFSAGRGTPPPPDSPTVAVILDGYRAEKEAKGVSPTLGYNVAHLKKLLGDLPVESLTKERVRYYAARRRLTGAGGAPAQHQATPRPLADSTIRRELLTLRAALVWAKNEGWTDAVPHIEAPKPGAARDRWLTRDEVYRLLASAKQDHVHVFMALALYTAGRAGAVLDLTWDRVNFETGIVDLGKGRGNKRRAAVPLHPNLRPVLERAYQARTSPWVVEHGGRKVVSVKTGFRNAAVRAGLPGVTAHVLRHTAATWMAQRGVSLERIAIYLGNSASTVERVYAHHTPDHMAEASAALS